MDDTTINMTFSMNIFIFFSRYDWDIRCTTRDETSDKSSSCFDGSFGGDVEFSELGGLTNDIYFKRSVTTRVYAYRHVETQLKQN